MFGLMNNMFNRTNEASKRELFISTFGVIPVKKYLGVMEWVKNTVPLKSIMENEMKEGEDFLNNKCVIKRMTYLRKITDSRDVREQHIGLLSVPRSSIHQSFTQQLQLFPKDLLKKAIKKKVQNAEQYIKIRHNFLKNYACLSLGSYMLGVGDRHLDNFLFDCKYGNIIPIDFGYSFGFGAGLPIPELMPFRFTQNFENLTYPLSSSGIFRNSMIYSLKALKDNHHVIIDACEVFIRDPMMDWLKMAQQKETEVQEGVEKKI